MTNRQRTTDDGEFRKACRVDLALAWHLASNHYPPVPESLVPVAARAVRYAKRGEWDKQLKLPQGVKWRGHAYAPVSACVTAWHLEAFLA